MPRSMRTEIEHAYRQLGRHATVHVRADDGRRRVAEVTGGGALIEAVVDIWASLWDEPACAEQLRTGGASEPSVKVIVELQPERLPDEVPDALPDERPNGGGRHQVSDEVSDPPDVLVVESHALACPPFPASSGSDVECDACR